MNKYILLIVLLTASIGSSIAQRRVIDKNTTTTTVIKKAADESFNNPIKKDRYKIAVLSPLFLDSTEWDKNLTRLPRFMMPGIDFYQGVRIAADSLEKQGYKIDLYVFDSKSAYLDVQHIIESDKLDSMDVIIGNASVTDLKLLADFAKKRKINFVSAVSPADAGQSANPYFTILQPRLQTHVETLHKNINRRYPEDNVVYVHRTSNPERNGFDYFKNDPMNSLPGRFSEMEITSDELNINKLIKSIDTNYNTVIVLGILDPEVTYQNLKILQPYAQRFHIKVYCMPTTEAVKSLSKTDEFSFMPIYYTTSYIIDQITPASQYISNQYKKKMGSKPTEIVYKGYESMYFFASLLKKYGSPFNKNIGDNSYTFITPYKIVPVKNDGVTDYYENKFLYLIKYEDGIMTYE